MKKFRILFFILLGWNSALTHAQNTSAQQPTYNLTPQQLSEINADMKPLPDSPGVEVAPPPDRLFPQENSSEINDDKNDSSDYIKK